MPTASVYAASKAAVSCFTESLHHNLVSEGTALRASVFYPSGGLLRTGLFTASPQPPRAPASAGARAPAAPSMTFDEMKEMLAKGGRDVAEADLDELGDFVVDRGRRPAAFIIARDLDGHRRAAPPPGRRHRRAGGPAAPRAPGRDRRTGRPGVIA